MKLGPAVLENSCSSVLTRLKTLFRREYVGQKSRGAKISKEPAGPLTRMRPLTLGNPQAARFRLRILVAS